MDTQRREDRPAAADDPEADSDTGSGLGTPDRAREAGIDATVLERLLSPMDAEDRNEIRELCSRDLDRTRRGVLEALDDWDPEALARHLHVMTSLAQTVGADALADEAGAMQVRLRSGASSGYDRSTRRMDDLARRAARFLAEATE